MTDRDNQCCRRYRVGVVALHGEVEKTPCCLVLEEVYLLELLEGRSPKPFFLSLPLLFLGLLLHIPRDQDRWPPDRAGHDCGGQGVNHHSPYESPQGRR